tara:strand:- start:105 stop:500 length:396 start_codon:yes stop_codon:yes gene_type:complete
MEFAVNQRKHGVIVSHHQALFGLGVRVVSEIHAEDHHHHLPAKIAAIRPQATTTKQSVKAVLLLVAQKTSAAPMSVVARIRTHLTTTQTLLMTMDPAHTVVHVVDNVNNLMEMATLFSVYVLNFKDPVFKI